MKSILVLILAEKKEKVVKLRRTKNHINNIKNHIMVTTKGENPEIMKKVVLKEQLNSMIRKMKVEEKISRTTEEEVVLLKMKSKRKKKSVV